MEAIRTNATIWDLAPEFGSGEDKIPAKYISYSNTECYWSIEPPIILSNNTFHFPKGSYREEFIGGLRCKKGQIVIAYREDF